MCLYLLMKLRYGMDRILYKQTNEKKGGYLFMLKKNRRMLIYYSYFLETQARMILQENLILI